jgi:hypothetical protein
MPVVINGTSGITGPDGSTSTPAVRGSDTDTGFVFAAGQITASLNGTSGNVPLVSMTAQASTSGTSIDFTGIPSWVKRITVMFQGLSTNGSSNHLVQIGSGSFLTTGYVSGSTMGQAGISSGTSTAGFLIHNSTSAANNYSGTCSILTLGNNAWVYSSLVNENVGRFAAGGGNVTLSGTLDRVRITTANGTDTFDAGSINIMYE